MEQEIKSSEIFHTLENLNHKKLLKRRKLILNMIRADIEDLSETELEFMRKKNFIEPRVFKKNIRKRYPHWLKDILECNEELNVAHGFVVCEFLIELVFVDVIEGLVLPLDLLL